MKGTKRGRRGKLGIRVLVLTLAVLMGAGSYLQPVQPVFAVGAEQVNGPIYAIQGDTDKDAAVEIPNYDASSSYLFYAVIHETDGVRPQKTESEHISIPPKGTGTVHFRLDIAKSCKEGTRSLSVDIYKEGIANPVDTATIEVEVGQRSIAPDGGKGLYASFDTNYKLSNSSGVQAGETNDLKFTLFNKGNTYVKNAVVKVTLPDSMSIVSGSNSESLGYINIGDTKTVTFKITADKNAEEKSYPVTFEINGADMGDSTQSVSQTFYIPIVGAGAESYSMKDIEITGVKAPQQSMAGEDFTLSFSVSNRGNVDAKDLKITVEPAEGVVNKTKSVFVETLISKGTSKSYEVTLFSIKDAAEKNYPIKIMVEPVKTKTDEAVTAVTQYAGVLIKADNTSGSGIKTPQLMVESYHYGGTYVQAGENFHLDLGLYNTSNKEIRNIKVTMTASDGVFVPVGGSNSFYIDSLSQKGRTDHTMVLSCKKDAEQKTTSMEIEMAYEDNSGNAFTSKDTISVPVMQETRLVVDDIVAPPEVYAGEPGGLSIQFYNMGKTTLSNLRVNAEGEFDTMESNSYFAGNMEAGKSDSFDFSFIPRQAGPMTGKVVFTYEDASGNQQIYEKPFTIEAMDSTGMEDPGMGEPPIEDGKKVPWIAVGIGGGAAAAAAALILLRRYRRKKKEQELEIDE